jgi:hypothetical protein
MSLADMRKELREMRKDYVKPVSRMKKGDISQEIEALRNRRETTPAAAATPSAPLKKLEPEVENIKDVKKSVFMKVPGAAVKDKMTKAAPEKVKAEMKGKAEAKMSKKDMLMKMLSEMSD